MMPGDPGSRSAQSATALPAAQRATISGSELEARLARAQPAAVESIKLGNDHLITVPQSLADLTFKNCDLSGIDLSGSRLAGVVFDNCSFEQTKLNRRLDQRTNLIAACFKECSLYGA